MKQKSAFYGQAYIQNAMDNMQRYPWAREIQSKIITEAETWLKMSNDELWELPFGSTLRRSYSVLSDGVCPACGKPVSMGEWVIEPLQNAWKVKCPCCNELFPKNDFYQYYRSGLDAKGIFRYELADETLLSAETDPDGNPKTCYDFGIDDGEGCMAGWCTQRRWWFIAAYLVYGQWKQKIVKGLQVLSNAYLVTSDIAYAIKAGILLDRIADFFPDYDYRRQGLVYEKGGDDGYVSTWHDSNIEVMIILLAYDAVFEAIKEDSLIVEFLHKKANQYQIENKKTSFSEVQKNIEERIFRDVLKHSRKVTLNYPGTDTLLTTIKVVIAEEEFKQDIQTCTGEIINWATKADGLTGEKGLGSYTSVTTDSMLRFIEILSLKDEGIISEILSIYPQVRDAFLFNTDAWFQDKYYPNVGDTGYVAGPMDFFNSFDFVNRLGCFGKLRDTPLLGLNMNTFLWRLFKVTKDSGYLEIILKKSNGDQNKEKCDIGMADAPAFYHKLHELKKNGAESLQKSCFNKQKWHLAALSSGSSDSERSVWMHYGAIAPHGHFDCMNTGLYAKGLDLMPDFGYPPVQYGGWLTEYAKWYSMAAAHNTVVVKGCDDKTPAEWPAGKTELWADGSYFRAMRASSDGYMGTSKYERTICFVDISEKDSYIVDLFSVCGGNDHAKFTHSTFGEISFSGIDLKQSADYGYDTLMKDFKGDEQASPGWIADWKVEDYHHVLPKKRDIHLKYIELTKEAGGYTAKAWINGGSPSTKKEAWLDVLMTRRTLENHHLNAGSEELKSNFVSILEPYENNSSIIKAQHLKTYASDHGNCNLDLAIEVELTDGRVDLILASDSEAGIMLEYKGVKIIAKASLCILRYTADQVTDIAISKGSYFKIGDYEADFSKKEDFIELQIHI